MKTLKTILIPVLIILSYPVLFGQHMDFDSLYQNDIAFKQQINSRPEFQSLFNSNAIVKLTIESDFKNLIKKNLRESTNQQF